MFTFNYHYQQYGNIHIHTTGCELSIYDAKKFANTLPKDEKAIVFNTCSFLAERELENRLILDLLTEAFPDYNLYILGCDVTNNPTCYNKYKGIVYNNDEVNEIVNPIIKNDIKNNEDIIYLKIQDGCRHQCSFCIINKLRNKPYSIPYKNIVETLYNEIGDRKKVSVQLAGTELTNYYDKDNNFRIYDVLNNLIQDVPEIESLTMTSLDPASPDIEKIIKVVNTHRNKIVPFLNLAVQSGSNTILEKMKRRHNIDRVREIHQIAKMNNIGLGWDIIVGFPGETEELFNETINLIKELKPLTKTIFSYSPRKGTIAYNMPCQISNDVKKNRLNYIAKLINDFLIDEDLDRNIKDSYKIFNKENLIDSDINVRTDKRRICELLFNGFAEKELDIFNIKEFAQFIKNPNKNCILSINYDIIRPLESNIYINFLKEYLKDIFLIVYMPKNYDIDVTEFEKYFHCVVIQK